MKTNVKHRTVKQREYVNALVKRNYSKKRPVEIKQEKPTREQYMHNCVFWINEYLNGRIDVRQGLKAAEHLQSFFIELFAESTTLKTNNHETKLFNKDV